MFRRIEINPTTGIIAAIAIILVMAGWRVVSRWDEISLFRDVGTLFALGLAGFSAVMLLVGYVKYQKRIAADDNWRPSVRPIIEEPARRED